MNKAVKSFLKIHWFEALFFSLAVICDAFMDYFNFQVPHDSGFWSLHTEGLRFDAWHSLKVLKWAFLAIGMTGFSGMIFVYGILNYVLHDFFYEKILKRK